MDISIVIIGRNEGFKLKKCFESINSCRNELNSSYNFQTIYVDSDSSDESLNIALQYNVDQIIRIKGDINPAIARNIGAKYAKYEWLLFIDGDMEVIHSFFRKKIVMNFLEKEYFFSGQFINIFYNSSWNKIGEDSFKANNKIETQWVPGGLFFVRKKLWEKFGGMKFYYKKGEDFEFGLRCFKAGYPFKRINLLLVRHHTISYLSQNRIIEFLKGGYNLYGRSLLYREHILFNFNKLCLKVLLKQDITLIFLLISVLCAPLLNYYSLLIYFIPFLLKVIKNRKSGLIIYMVYLLIRDITVAFGLLFFYPSKNLKYNVENVNKK